MVRINIAGVVRTAHKLEGLGPAVVFVGDQHFLPLDEVLPEDTYARVAIPWLLKRHQVAERPARVQKAAPQHSTTTARARAQIRLNPLVRPFRMTRVAILGN